MNSADVEFSYLLGQISQCQQCGSALSHGARPIVQAHPQARILIVGQAPGLAVHQTGIPFNDASGERLRQWLAIDKASFYNPKKVAIVPMGFCYPGKGVSGDLPPRKECAPLWHQPLLAYLTQIQLTIVIGQYALKYHLPEIRLGLTDAVKNWQQFNESILVLPHPSPRNNIWLAKNPWFDAQVLPVLKQRVKAALEK
ncbi:uracil-DNA glycosylase family protein [Shewanella intestini]|uniref:Uracil-DNA glycosylase family protein n=1 Tax=Shewanella intestini TaxID=2017544 RepID=A0ABS5I6H4_9GAMM|nr:MULTISPECIES: uracil-DNA glycosylase family protein [Shewanella]MBR9728980.1 uracil-DNA glycosylase family protein [Shewanella intestini]MRG36954.1 uracil-DNA glycosylase family protein [Shewanella sp. XMDDZSB0408]